MTLDIKWWTCNEGGKLNSIEKLMQTLKVHVSEVNDFGTKFLSSLPGLQQLVVHDTNKECIMYND